MQPRIFPLEYQTDLQDCGPACLKMVTEYFGKSCTLDFIKEQCHTTDDGTSIFDMRIAAENLGLHAIAIKGTMDHLLNDVPLPAIALWRDIHFVVVYMVDDECICTCDPAIGCILYTYEEFQKGWYLKDENKGILLAVEDKECRFLCKFVDTS